MIGKGWNFSLGPLTKYFHRLALSPTNCGNIGKQGANDWR